MPKYTGFTSPLVHAPGDPAGYAYRQGMGMMESAEFFSFFDDFKGAVATNVPAGWSAAIIDVGATVVADSTTPTGALLFDSDGATEGASIYLPETWTLTQGKKFFMEIRVKPEIADDSDVQFGFSDLTAVVNPEDLWTTTSASLIAFGTLDGSAVTGMLSDKSNSGSAVVAGTRSLTSNTWHTLAIGYDGANLRGFVDGRESVRWTGAHATTVPFGVTLAPFFGWRNGSAATTEGMLDYFRLVIER